MKNVALVPVLPLAEISTALGSLQQLGRVVGMSPAASRLMCASLGSWDRCLFVLGSESLAWLHVALARKTSLAGFSPPLNQASPWSVQAKGLNLSGAGSRAAVRRREP